MKLGKLIFLGIFLLSYTHSFSQQSEWQQKETIILLDGKPSKVVISREGEIIKIIDDVKTLNFNDKNSPDRILEIANSKQESTKEENESALVQQTVRSGAIEIKLIFNQAGAVLSKNNLEGLESAVELLLRNPEKNIMLVSFATEADQQLAYNKINACEQYLALRGIEKSRILTELKDQSNANFHKLVLLTIY